MDAFWPSGGFQQPDWLLHRPQAGSTIPVEDPLPSESSGEEDEEVDELAFLDRFGHMDRLGRKELAFPAPQAEQPPIERSTSLHRIFNVNELLSLIMAPLEDDKPTLLTACLVSKSWQRASQPWLFSTLSITPLNASVIRQLLEDRPDLAGHVRSLTLNPTPGSNMVADSHLLLSPLLPLLPSLLHLSAFGSQGHTGDSILSQLPLSPRLQSIVITRSDDRDLTLLLLLPRLSNLVIRKHSALPVPGVSLVDKEADSEEEKPTVAPICVLEVGLDRNRSPGGTTARGIEWLVQRCHKTVRSLKVVEYDIGMVLSLLLTAPLRLKDFDFRRLDLWHLGPEATAAYVANGDQDLARIFCLLRHTCGRFRMKYRLDPSLPLEPQLQLLRHFFPSTFASLTISRAIGGEKDAAHQALVDRCLTLISLDNRKRWASERANPIGLPALSDRDFAEAMDAVFRDERIFTTGSDD